MKYYFWNGLSTDTKDTTQVGIGALALETDTGNEYQWTGSAWLQTGAAGVPRSAIIDPNTKLPIGIQNGGIKVANVYDPARDVFLSWFFGSDGALQTLTVNVANNGLWLDTSLISTGHRQLVIVNGNAASDYAYTLQMSRNGLGVTTDDTYTGVTSGAAARAQIVAVNLPAANGYDNYARLVITPTAAQAGSQLTFKAYLIGRGG